jgi:hypothetical protein
VNKKEIEKREEEIELLIGWFSFLMEERLKQKIEEKTVRWHEINNDQIGRFLVDPLCDDFMRLSKDDLGVREIILLFTDIANRAAMLADIARRRLLLCEWSSRGA